MVTSPQRYTLESVKQDVMSFFKDNNHWAYQYGSRSTSCNKDSVFYKKQIQVIFEDLYPHDVTGKAVNELIQDGFLKLEPRFFGKNDHAIFVWRYNVRYTSNEIKGRIRIMKQFFDEELNKGAGREAENLFNHLFKANQFRTIARHTRTFRGKTWPMSGKNLDFIIEKDGICYGVEVKNTLDYMPPDEFQEKLDMCHFLGLLPMFPLRCPSDQQFATMEQIGGMALKFKSRIFPQGNRRLINDIWNHFRLPVTIWDEIPPPIQRILIRYHHYNTKTKAIST